MMNAPDMLLSGKRTRVGKEPLPPHHRPIRLLRPDAERQEVRAMYQEVALLAGSAERQFSTFHVNPLENVHEITTNKGVFYKRASLLRQKEDAYCPEEGYGGAAIINVGGIKYRIPWTTLEEFPLTRLGKLKSCNNLEEIMDVCDDYDISCNEFFFDRNPSAFRAIVTFLAAGKLRLLREVCALSFQEELLYWGVEEASLEWCCLRKLRQRQEEEQEAQRQDGGQATPPSEEAAPCPHVDEGRTAGCMRRLRDMVENPHSGLPGKIFACLSVIFVAITAVTLCISTMPDLRAQEERVSPLRRFGSVHLYFLTAPSMAGTVMLISRNSSDECFLSSLADDHHDFT